MSAYVSVPLPLEGARNVRDLGGYPAEGGKVTRRGAFLRADGLQDLTASDREALARRGVRLIVDLRSGTEAARMPDPPIEGAERRRISMIDDANSQAARFAEGQGQKMVFPESMAPVYVQLLRGAGTLFAEALLALAVCPGVGLFHCSAGKDRTGLVAMLLLKVCGVSDADVIRDYAVTEVYMADKFAVMRAQMRNMGVDATGAMFSSAPENMEAALACLRELGGAEAYLLANGLEPEAIAAIRAKLLGGGEKAAEERFACIRPACAEDAGRVAEIRVFCSRLSFYPIFQDDGYYFSDLCVLPLAREWLDSPEEIANTYVYDDGAVKGFILLDGTEAVRLYVEPVLQGRGVGAALLEWAVREKGVDRLWALEKNARAVRFYARHGFFPSGERKLEEDTTEYLILLRRA